ncbi:MAG: zinc-binding dehydrogenase, partial [Thermoanaerobaculia bacterium]
MSVPTHHRTVFLLGPERVELRSVPVPDPGPGELLVRIEAATTCGTDVKVLRRGGHPRMLHVPTPFGHEMAGTVAAAGTGQNRWKIGERVVVANSAPCGACEWCLRDRENLCAHLQYLNGAFAEYLLVPRRFAEVSTYALPAGLPAEVGALAEPLACVLHGLEVCALGRPAEIV